MNEIKGFTFFRSYAEALEELNDKEQKELLVTIVNFVFKNKIPNFKKGSKLRLAWVSIEPILTKSKNKSNRSKTKTKTESN